jgi:hypothetical protein
LLQDACEQIVKLGFDDGLDEDVIKQEKDTKDKGTEKETPRVESKEATSSQSVASTVGKNSHSKSVHSVKTPPMQVGVENDDNSTIMTGEGSHQSKQSHPPPPQTTGSASVHSTGIPSNSRKITNALTKSMLIINYIHVLMKTESFTLLKQSVHIKDFLLQCFAQLSNAEKHKLKNCIIPEVDAISVFSLNDLFIPKKQINQIIAILDQCQKEHDYHLKQIQSLGGGSSVTGDQKSIGGEGGEKDDDDNTVMSDIKSVNSHHMKGSSATKKQRSKQMEKSKTQGTALSVLTQDEEDGNDDDLTVQSQSKKRQFERDSKKSKYMEQKKKDQLLRQEISQQRNALYNLIQTNQISEIFDRVANKMNRTENVKWSGSSKKMKGQPSVDEMEEKELEDEDAEEAFVELAKGVASRKVIP